ncbi:hypothetical protein HFN59_25775 [Rhizobium leguminosarum]|uniref:hypothetical protein n=1 Tax=Rhizobium leguminosarum TaxID=384 RepID=UPI001C9642AC|nr:hypothetical protein [Rhizobium leguminosarum]MBY5780489.1 hypothetical protein [Rhizobium leguminosarum]
MTSFYNHHVDETVSTVLLIAFQEACARHDISPDSEDGSDLLTVLLYAFQKGTTTKDALVGLALNLIGK